jgi:hypothetical protein
MHASWAVDLKRMEIDDIIINTPKVNIPLSFCLSTQGKIGDIIFEKKDYAILGTDILRNFNYGVNVNATPYFIINKPTRTVPPRKSKIPRFDFED